MISRADIVGRVREWGLAEHVVEKDYVLGWVLWGIGSDATLGDGWVFKGGTCLKKCFVETYRFSEDLDFTILPDGPLTPDEVLPLLRRVLQRVGEEYGIDFTIGEPRLRIRPSGTAAEGRIYYRGPRNTPGATSVKLDLSADETVVRPTVPRTITHPYPDALPAPGTARCYSFEEVFAEKLRAMAQRGRPRDLYGIVNLFRRNDLRLPAAPVRETLVAKCKAKGIAVPTAETIASAPHRAHDRALAIRAAVLASAPLRRRARSLLHHPHPCSVLVSWEGAGADLQLQRIQVLHQRSRSHRDNSGVHHPDRVPQVPLDLAEVVRRSEQLAGEDLSVISVPVPGVGVARQGDPRASTPETARLGQEFPRAAHELVGP